MARLDPSGSDAARALDLVSQVVDYAIIGLDADGVIRSWNAGAERLKGYSSGEAVGRHFSIFYTADDRDRGLPEQLLHQAVRDGRVAHTGWRVRRDGTRFWGDVVITALRDDDGGLTGFAKVTRDRTEEHLLQESLRETESRMRVLVSQVVDYAIIGLDTDGVIRSWNAGAERLKGYREEEALGQHFSLFYIADDREAGLPEQMLGQARTHGRAAARGWRVRKDGTRFWGDVVVTALYAEDGRHTGFAKVTRERTEQHRLEELQSSLFAMLSHDVRQPLTAIGVHAELIADSEPEVRAEYAERILRSAEQLGDMISTLFDHARLRAGGVVVHPEPVPLGPALRDAAAAYDRPAEGRAVRVTDDGVIGLADPLALRRVLANLLTNAIKYSPDGSSVEVAARGDGDDAVITVADHGRGIAAEDLPVIFDEFVRGRLATNDGGTGLGLASVKHLVEAHGGAVSIASELGVGTTVTVRLPRAEL